MEIKVKIGSALPNDGWQYMATQDPNPRIPFCYDAPVSKGEATAWGGVALLIFCVVSFLVTV